MSAQVSNAAMVGSLARLNQARAMSATARQQVDGLEGTNAPPARDQQTRYDEYADRFEGPPARRRHGEFQDHVISFGGVLVSLEVGATIVETQALNHLIHPLPAEAERQVANYEFVQSMAGPAEPIMLTVPFP
jgi:hypothetical protein